MVQTLCAGHATMHVRIPLLSAKQCSTLSEVLTHGKSVPMKRQVHRRRKGPVYRHWLEYPMLAITIAALAIAPAFVMLILALNNGGFTFVIDLDQEGDRIRLLMALAGLAALFLGALMSLGLLALWTARRKLNRLRRGAVRVSATQFPEIYELAQQMRGELGVAVPVAVYLLDSQKMERGIKPISVLGFTKPYFIIISTMLVAEMTPGELGYLLGVQYGHIRLGHVRMLTVIDSVSGSLGRVPFVGGFIRFMFSGWTRLAVFSADRAGLIATRRLENAYGALIKLVIDARHFPQLNHAELAAQAKRTREGASSLFGQTTMPFDTQPLGRFDRLVPFAVSPQFRQLCPEADLSFVYLPCWL